MGISLGLVGLGSFGSAFARLFKSHPLVDRVGLCDREPERIGKFAEDPFFQDKFSPSDAYASLEEILKSDLDALAIITQHWLHTPQAVQAMGAGKHVYSAVPLLSVPDGDEILDWCDKLVDTVRRSGLHYMYGETTYYRPSAMYCRRRAGEGAFGDFVHAQGEYLHAFDSPGCDLREVARQRLGSAAGAEWAEKLKGYRRRGIQDGPMHYPTHSTSGPVCVMNAHMTRVCAWGYHNRTGDSYFHDGESDPAGRFSNETAHFLMSNGATCLIREYREIGNPGNEGFRIFGTQGCYRDGTWFDKSSWTALTAEEMRDPLPEEVLKAFAGADPGVYGGHGGSHAYLVHEFVDAVAHDRMPAVTAWDAVRYTAPGVVAHKSALADGEILSVPDWGDPPRT